MHNIVARLGAIVLMSAQYHIYHEARAISPKSRTLDKKLIIPPWLLNFSTIVNQAIIEMDGENISPFENLDNLML
jgi:hypothetical protein